MGLKNSQYDEIIRKYNQTGLKNKHISDLRSQEVYQLLPDFQVIDNEIASLSVEHGKKLLNGQDLNIEDLKDRIHALSAKRIELLTQLGYSADYLDSVYTCPDCKDTGYINNQKCHCFKQFVIDMLYSSSNLEHTEANETFKHFTYDYYSDDFKEESTGLTALSAAKRAYIASRDFVDSFDLEFHNLFFYGRAGVGKTFLSNCIAKELIDTSHSVIYFSAPQLFNTLAKSSFDHDLESSEASQYIYNCDLLIIDDLGTELINSFVSSQLFSCVNERILKKRSTIISTNISINKLVDTYSERTFSRISSNYTMLKLIGDDIRLKKKHL
ncbi:MAG: ATP-binding protein [Lachnotalea sp.]